MFAIPPEDEHDAARHYGCWPLHVTSFQIGGTHSIKEKKNVTFGFFLPRKCYFSQADVLVGSTGLWETFWDGSWLPFADI